jgi:hypothetical protein
VVERADEIPALLEAPLQHNEVTRAAALMGGFMLLARRGMPLRLLEVGTSAGLLLRWDHYRGARWLPPLFDVRPPLDGPVEVSERRGCDLFPIDPTTGEGALRLKSYVWADLADHVRILEEAIEVARQVPVEIDQEDGADWLLRRLPERGEGTVDVVFHSLMRQSGPPASLARMQEVLSSEGRRATDRTPLAYLRFEAPVLFDAAQAPGETRRLVETRLTVWPGGDDRLLATSDTNGRHVLWLGHEPGEGGIKLTSA